MSYRPINKYKNDRLVGPLLSQSWNAATIAPDYQSLRDELGRLFSTRSPQLFARLYAVVHYDMAQVIRQDVDTFVAHHTTQTYPATKPNRRDVLAHLVLLANRLHEGNGALYERHPDWLTGFVARVAATPDYRQVLHLVEDKRYRLQHRQTWLRTALVTSPVTGADLARLANHPDTASMIAVWFAWQHQHDRMRILNLWRAFPRLPRVTPTWTPTGLVQMLAPQFEEQWHLSCALDLSLTETLMLTESNTKTAEVLLPTTLADLSTPG